MKLFITILVLVGLYFILKPSIDRDPVTGQIILWYGSESRRKFVILYNPNK